MSSLDDIDYMQEHADTQDYLLFVDSARRNTQADKTPSQYQVNFDIPFYNVCGIEVLDTTFPRTQYLVDVNNNQVAYQIDGEGWSLFQVDNGDYNVTQLCELLGLGLVSNNKTVSVQPLSDPADVKGQLKFTSNYPFELNMSRSSMRKVVGFSNPVIVDESPRLYDTAPGYVDGSDDIFVANVDTGNVSFVSSFNGPAPILDAMPLTVSPTCQLFTAAQSGFVSQVQVQVERVGSPTGNSVHFDLIDASGTVFGSGDINVLLDNLDSPSICNDVYNPKVLVINKPYYLSLTTDTTDVSNTYSVFNAQPSTPQSSVPGIYTGPDVGNLAAYSDPTQQLCCQVLQGGLQYRVITPGLFNLTGERYILIRCPEIESHIYNSQAFTQNYNMGLTKVQMAIYGYGNNRYDFSNYASRMFHPIGKLKKMTLIFQCADGTLYDFKGVDHTLTMKIKYYEPKRQTMHQYLLNPKYNPNLLDYNRAAADEQRRLRWQQAHDAVASKLAR